MDEKDKKRSNPNRRLRAARERRGWSQAVLAEQLGTNELTVGRWERGERYPQVFYRSKLCELFDMTAEELGLVKGKEVEISEGEKVFPRAEATILSSPEASLPGSSVLSSEPQGPVLDLLPLEKEATSSNQREASVPTLSFAELPAQSEDTDKKVSSWSVPHRRNWLPIFIGSLLIIGLVVLLGVGTIFSSPKTTSAHRSSARSVSSPVSSLPSESGHMLADPSGTPVVDDPMIHSSVQTQWSTGTHCTFADGIFRLHSIGVNYCLANAQIFTNFHYQIQVTLLEGSQAGVVFRANGNSQLYYFYIDTHGTYGVELVNQNDSKMLRSGPIQELKQTNELDVIARGADFKLYVNRQLVAQVHDSTFPSGYIGVCVDTDMSDPAQANVTTAAFKDAKVWA